MGRKSTIETINNHIWGVPGYVRILPKDYILSISNEKFIFTKEFVNVNAADQMITTISKSGTPQRLILSHSSHIVLNECVDWLIKYGDTCGKLIPEFESKNFSVFDRLEKYRKLQKKKNKRRRKPLYK